MGGFAANNNKSWIVLGDLNAILHAQDRIGSNLHEVVDFRACLEAHGLKEMRYTGSAYTQSNRQDPIDRGYSKIDRAFINHEALMAWDDMQT